MNESIEKKTTVEQAVETYIQYQRRCMGVHIEKTDSLIALIEGLINQAREADKRRIEELEGTLAKVNDIRNSIIGLQAINWSEHIYPLVAALDAAGIEGMGYPEARAKYGTMIERTVKAEEKATQLESQVLALTKVVEAAQRMSGGMKFSALHPPSHTEPHHNACMCGNCELWKAVDAYEALSTTPAADIRERVRLEVIEECIQALNPYTTDWTEEPLPNPEQQFGRRHALSVMQTRLRELQSIKKEAN